MINISPADVASFEHSLESYIHGGAPPALKDYPDIARALIDNNGRDNLPKLKELYKRCYDIMKGNLLPEPAPLVTEALKSDLRRCVDDKGKLDYHPVAEILMNYIHFLSTDEDALYFYDPISGIWKDNGQNTINKILRDAFSEGLTRFAKDEIITHIRDKQYQAALLSARGCGGNTQ